MGDALKEAKEQLLQDVDVLKKVVSRIRTVAEQFKSMPRIESDAPPPDRSQS